MNAYRDGAVPTELQVAQRALADADRSANRRLFRLTSDPDLETYDPAKSAEYILAVVRGADQDDLGWIMSNYRLATEDVRAAIGGSFNIIDFFSKSALAGDVVAKLELGMLMRENAQSSDDLSRSARWLLEAAEAGNPQGMAEYGFALAYGLGVPRDPGLAIEWLDRAASAGLQEAALNARLVRLSASQ